MNKGLCFYKHAPGGQSFLESRYINVTRTLGKRQCHIIVLQVQDRDRNIFMQKRVHGRNRLVFDSSLTVLSAPPRAGEDSFHDFSKTMTFRNRNEWPYLSMWDRLSNWIIFLQNQLDSRENYVIDTPYYLTGLMLKFCKRQHIFLLLFRYMETAVVQINSLHIPKPLYMIEMIIF